MDDDLKYIARLILGEKLGAVEFIDKHHPSITNRLRVLGRMQMELEKASKYLHENPPSTQGLGVASYLSWSGRVFIEVGKHGFANAVPFIQADLIQFVADGFDENLCKRLASLQAITI